MPDIKNETIVKLTGMKETKPTISDVKQQAENISVIDETIEAAKKLAGSSTLEEELKRKDKRMEDLQKEKDKTTEQLHESQIVNVKTELGSKIDHLAESLKGGASPKSLTDEIVEIKKAANELGMGGSKVSEIKEIMALVTSLNPKTNLVDQIKDAKDLLTALQPAEDKDKGGTVEGVPASVAIELKRMDHNLQITLEQMKDDRQRKDQDFKLILRKYDDDRVARQQEVVGKIEVEKERNDLIAGGLETVGRAIGKGMAEAGGGAGGVGGSGGAVAGRSQTQKSPGQPYHLEIAEGEIGEFECPTCKAKGMENVMVGVGPSSTEAVCAWCTSKYPITRHPATTVEPEPIPK